MTPEGLGFVASVSTLDIRRLQRRHYLPDGFKIHFHVVTRSSRVTSFAECVHRQFSSWLLSTHESSWQARWKSIFVTVRYSRSRLVSSQTSAAFGRWKFVRVQASGHSALWRRGWVQRRDSCTSHVCGGGRAVCHIFGPDLLFDGYVVTYVLEDMAQQSRREDGTTRDFVSFHFQVWNLLGAEHGHHGETLVSEVTCEQFYPATGCLQAMGTNSPASLTGSTPLLLSASTLGMLQPGPWSKSRLRHWFLFGCTIVVSDQSVILPSDVQSVSW